MTRRRSKSDIASSLFEAGAIFWLAPWVMAERMSKMAAGTPMEAFVSMHGFANEKMIASLHSATAVTVEAIRQSTHLAQGRTHDAYEAIARLTHAAIEPVARQVRANAAGPGRK